MNAKRRIIIFGWSLSVAVLGFGIYLAIAARNESGMGPITEQYFVGTNAAKDAILESFLNTKAIAFSNGVYAGSEAILTLGEKAIQAQAEGKLGSTVIRDQNDPIGQILRMALTNFPQYKP